VIIVVATLNYVYRAGGVGHGERPASGHPMIHADRAGDI